MICLSRICSSMVGIANHTNMGMISSRKKKGVFPYFCLSALMFSLLSSSSVQSNTLSPSSAPGIFGRCILLREC